MPPFRIDATSCYDPKRSRIYIGGGSYPVAPEDTHSFWIYDSNAVFIHSAGDSRDDSTMWVYRYKRVNR